LWAHRAPEGLAGTDQLIKITRASWDLGNGPIPDGSEDGNDIHLQEEVTEGGIRQRSLELDTKRLREHSVMTPRKTHQITQALAFAQDAEHRHQQQATGRDANPSTHPGIRDRLEVADQIEIDCGRNGLEHREGVIPPTSPMLAGPARMPVTHFESALPLQGVANELWTVVHHRVGGSEHHFDGSRVADR
jgi:hypothetical protein